MRILQLSFRFAVTTVFAFCCLICAGEPPAQSSAESLQQLWSEASAAQRLNNYVLAAAWYQKILDLQPDFVEAEINLGLMDQLAGNLHAAIPHFEHVLLANPKLYVPNLLAGLDYLKLDNPSAALPHLKRAQAAKPEDKVALDGLANAYLQLHMLSLADVEFHRAINLDKTNADAWYGLGATYLTIEKEGEEQLRRSLSPFRMALLSESYLQQKQTGKAIATLTTLLDKSSVVPCAHTQLGFAYLQDSKKDEAAQQFKRDWNLQSTSRCTLAKLGFIVVEGQRGNGEEALRQLRETEEIDPAFVQLNIDLFWDELVKAGVEAPARAILEQHRSEAGRSVVPKSYRDDFEQGRYSRCSAALALHLPSLNLGKLLTLSRCAYYVGRDDLVLQATSSRLKVLPTDDEALYWRVQSAGRLAMTALTNATKINPASATLHVMLGDMLRGKGEMLEAAGEYRRAIDIKPDFIAAHMGLARDLYSDNKSIDSEVEVQIVLHANAEDPEANYLMGELLVKRNAFSQALPYLLLALHVKEEDLPFVHADLSEVYEDRGDSPLAISELTQALSVDADGSYHYRLGRLYLSSGNRAAADQAMRESALLHQATNSSGNPQKQ